MSSDKLRQIDYVLQLLTQTCTNLLKVESEFLGRHMFVKIKTLLMKTIKIKELEVPVGIIAKVADILVSNDLENGITGTDEDQEIIFLEVRYDKDEEEQREAIHQIEDVINDYEDDADDNEK